MIEFKGAYYNKLTDESKSVLVQFDGVLLHVWQMADPFCRLLSSDVFTLQSTMAKGKRCIKLPNGGKIETDDVNAIASLRINTCSRMPIDGIRLLSQRNIIFIACGFVILASAYLIGYHLLS